MEYDKPFKTYREQIDILKNRYELYVRATKRGQKGFILDVDLVTPDTLRDMWDFFRFVVKWNTYRNRIPLFGFLGNIFYGFIDHI